MKLETNISKVNIERMNLCLAVVYENGGFLKHSQGMWEQAYTARGQQIKNEPSYNEKGNMRAAFSKNAVAEGFVVQASHNGIKGWKLTSRGTEYVKSLSGKEKPIQGSFDFMEKKQSKKQTKKKISRKRRTPIKKEIVVLDSKTNNNYLIASLIGAHLVTFVLVMLNLFG